MYYLWFGFVGNWWQISNALKFFDLILFTLVVVVEVSMKIFLSLTSIFSISWCLASPIQSSQALFLTYIIINVCSFLRNIIKFILKKTTWIDSSTIKVLLLIRTSIHVRYSQLVYVTLSPFFCIYEGIKLLIVHHYK